MTRFTCLGCGKDCLGPPEAPEATKACDCPTRVVKNQDTGKNEWCDNGEPDWQARAQAAEARANSLSDQLKIVREALERIGETDTRTETVRIGDAWSPDSWQDNTVVGESAKIAAQALSTIDRGEP